MRLGLRGKLFLVLVVSILVIVVVGALLLPPGLERSLRTRIAEELDHEAALAAIVLSRRLTAATVAAAVPLADELGEATRSRVTIVLADGRVVGDSALDPTQVATLESHRDRPEVVAALARGKGHDTRYSTTRGHELMYFAARFDAPVGRGVVRFARPLVEVRDAGRTLYGLLSFAALLGLGIALVAATISSHVFSRALRALVHYAEHAEEGPRPTDVTARRDELGGLASSVQQLAGRLTARVTELANERRRFEDVLEGMSEALIALDEHRHVTLINRAGLLLIGVPERPLGRSILELTRVPELSALIDDLAPGSQATGEFDLGPLAPRRVLARAKRREPGDYVIVLLDVTELRRLENLRRDFVSNVSHELRTPVSIIKANAETLQDGALADPEAAQHFLGSITKHADRLARLISDLLDLSRIEEARYGLHPAPVPVGDALARAAAALETPALAKAITIQVTVPAGLVAECDPLALDQVLFNLVDNAVKYTPTGGRVILTAARREDGVLIEVADDGPGIEPRHRDRLFERFYRVDTGRSREMGGTGLGLAIVKHLVVAMQGQVGMRPAPVRGSIFWVLLPTHVPE